MKIIRNIKDKNNQLDLDKLCSIMTKEEKEEDSELMKLSKIVAMVARLRLI